MKKIFLVTVFLWGAKTFAQTWNTEEQYIQRFALYAVEEMEKYQIPASITLAQGLLETGGGQSRLAREGNNHFGIKCKEGWTGPTMKHTDDAPNECFRVYTDPKESYEDHSKFLRYRKYYQGLFNLDPKDYKAWAHGLKKAGYATNPKYAYILIGKIEKHRLYEFDSVSAKDVWATVLNLYPDLKNDKEFMAKSGMSPSKKEPVAVRVASASVAPQKPVERFSALSDKAVLPKTILVKNHPNGGRKYVVVPYDSDVALVARMFDIKENRLMKWNELEETKLAKNAIVFLEGKASSGNVATYKTQRGDTMYGISQKFGVKLASLYSKNRMAFGEEPTVGQTIYLQERKPRGG
ncbi:glucosaminidase domain-containing protein [Bergeyella sp. RCAD1439]|uniref:glucosaminidase domain-containing protein n=1 Tax=Bergeyella anatis TaxID=3113737 RepID=UPI002E1720D7|nr:glucosaminidase domain-containing protein [Bergeyella sp. RCAD1439]